MLPSCDFAALCGINSAPLRIGAVVNLVATFPFYANFRCCHGNTVYVPVGEVSLIGTLAFEMLDRH